MDNICCFCSKIKMKLRGLPHLCLCDILAFLHVLIRLVLHKSVNIEYLQISYWQNNISLPSKSYFYNPILSSIFNKNDITWNAVWLTQIIHKASNVLICYTLSMREAKHKLEILLWTQNLILIIKYKFASIQTLLRFIYT